MMAATLTTRNLHPAGNAQPLPSYSAKSRVLAPAGKGAVLKRWWYGRPIQASAATVPPSWRYLVRIDDCDHPIDYAEIELRRLHEPRVIPAPSLPNLHRRVVRIGLLQTTTRLDDDTAAKFWGWVLGGTVAGLVLLSLLGRLGS